MDRLRVFGVLVLALACGLGVAVAHDKITTVIGGGPNGIPGLAANVSGQLALDGAGNLYIASGTGASGAIYKQGPSGTVTHIAGDGNEFFDGSGGAALKTQLGASLSIAVDGAVPAHVFIADKSNCVVWRLDQSAGTLSTVAGFVDTSQGTGVNSRTLCGYSGDGGAANGAMLLGPEGPAVNPGTGDLYFVDGYATNVVRKVAGGVPLGTITTVAGEPGQFCATQSIANGALATSVPLCGPRSLGLDRSVTPANLLIGDNCAVDEVVGATGKIYRVAGTNGTPDCGFVDGVVATAGKIGQVGQISVASHGGTAVVAIADFVNANVVQFSVGLVGGVPQPGTLTVVAGTAGPGPQCTLGGTVALGACVYPYGIAGDGAGNLYLADSCNHAVREVFAATGTIATVAGLYQSGGYSGDGPATQVELNDPVGVKADRNGNLFLTDSDNGLVRWVTPSGWMVTFGGLPTQPPFLGSFCAGSFYGDGGPALDGVLNSPAGIDQDSDGNFYVADMCNFRVRQISAFAGYGLSASSLSFGTQGVGTTSGVQTVTVSAIGPTKIAVLHLSHGFTETDDCAGRELATGQTCTVRIAFAPKAAGSVTGTLRIYSNALLGNPDVVALGGVGN